jgi:hypothetical protein
MPNWCNNTLIVKGKSEDIKVFKEKYKGKINDTMSWLNFEQVISSKENQELIKPKWNALTKEENKRWKNDFIQYWFNTGGVEWCCKNWGTKWNIEVEEPRTEKGELIYGFDTAWSPPEPVIKKLIELHPELEFNLEFEEWGVQFMGILAGKNGVITIEETFECDTAECPYCEYTTSKKRVNEKFVCGECGKIFTAEESKKAEEERENGE